MTYFTAAALEEQQRPLVLRQLEIPEYLSVGQVLVLVMSSGICGAQLNEIAGTKGPDKYLPHTLGHEGHGIVVATGPGVKHVKPRDSVVIHWRKGVGIESEPPKYWCPELREYIGGGWNTTFQEYSVVSENRLTKIPDDVPSEIAALFGCAVTTGLGIVANEAQVKMGQSVVVFGCGGVGLSVLQGCLLASAYPVIGVDISETKLKQALVMGATHVILNDTPDGFNKIRHILPEGADFVIDRTGSPRVMEAAFDIAARDGKVIFVAQLHHQCRVSLQTLPMQMGRTVLGSDGGGTCPSTDIPRYVRLLKAGRLNLQQLITHRYPLCHINKALDIVRTGACNRCIIYASDDKILTR